MPQLARSSGEKLLVISQKAQNISSVFRYIVSMVGAVASVGATFVALSAVERGGKGKR